MRAALLLLLIALTGCSTKQPKPGSQSKQSAGLAPSYFKVDPHTAGSVVGTIQYSGKRSSRQVVDMTSDPACVEAHHGKAHEDSIAVNSNGTLANVFVYIKSGLEGKSFAVPAKPVQIDQKGCWFEPRILGIQVGQRLEVINSDPVTHNIHPMAQINREWNHSQGSGDAPLARKFLKPEVMIRVKCNIHSWMHAYIGVLDHSYYSVTGADGTFKIENLPPGKYVLSAWQEQMGNQEATVTLSPSAAIQTKFVFTGE